MQRYTEIPGSETLSNSLKKILDNDKTSLTCQAGTAFPTVDIREGMLCYRTDLQKLYQCVDAETVIWRVIADLSGNARLLDGGFGNVINYDKMNLNSWDDMPTGFYQGSNMLNSPEGDTAWRVIQIREGNSDGYCSQLAFGVSSGKMCMRFEKGGIWSAWNEVYTGNNGKVVTGMNADKVDGYEPSHSAGGIPISDGKLNENLNADLLDGYQASNKASSIPISNGVVNAGLNADQLDGAHAGNEKDNIPISNGKLNTNLNAEMVGGLKVKNLLQIQDDGAIPRTIKSATIQTLALGGTTARAYSKSVPTNRDLGASEKFGVDVSTTEGSGVYSSTSYWSTIDSAIGQGNYDLYNILQRLINVAHVHKVYKHKKYYNCHCDCRCDCECGDDNCQ